MKTKRFIKDYLLIAIAMMLGALGWIVFLLPNRIALGGITGIASIFYWGFGIPAQAVYFGLNALLLLIALRILGWRFCVKTIFGVIVFTLFSSFLQGVMGDTHLLADQKFMATIVGGAFMGISVGLGLSAG
ncbi:MAG: YitT family protein, partial [Prevotella sp.]|nr:YitT family protein [Prevotella sp.]